MCENYYRIGYEPNGKNINDGVGSTHLEAITKLVKTNKLDIGLSFDGDGDRVLVVDKDLDIIDGDLIIYIIANYLKEKGLLKKDVVNFYSTYFFNRKNKLPFVTGKIATSKNNII